MWGASFEESVLEAGMVGVEERGVELLLEVATPAGETREQHARRDAAPKHFHFSNKNKLMVTATRVNALSCSNNHH